VKDRQKYILLIIALLAAACAIYFLRTIVLYVVIAVIISMMGQPVMKFLGRIRYKRLAMPDWLTALLSLSAICLVAIIVISLFVPLVVEEARIISEINPNEVVTTFREPLKNLEYDLAKFQISYGNGESIEKYLADQLSSLLNFQLLTGYAQGMIGFTASFLGASFAILFMAFFFMKDESLISRSVLLLTPPKYIPEVKDILRDSKRLLTRYFCGLLLDMIFVGGATAAGLALIGVENAILIGMFAGLINIIPYVGPLIGLAFGLVIGITSNLHIEFYTMLLPLLGKICITFILVQLADALFFQPLVISNIVKAHPLEIFLVIMIAGTLAGIGGMIVAVPVYTILRIVAKEFLSNFLVVKKLTEDLEEST
jgi:predicted PurR-regulated permease PerM